MVLSCKRSRVIRFSALGRLHGRHPVLGEVLEAFHHPKAEPPYEGQRCIAARGEHLRCVTRVGACLILATTHIAHVMEAILDTPVRARQGEQLFRICPIHGQAGNGMDGFDGFLATYDAFTRDAADLCHAGPERAQMPGQSRGHFQLVALDPAVAFLDRFAPPEVRRRRPCRRGGKRPEGQFDIRFQGGPGQSGEGVGDKTLKLDLYRSSDLVCGGGYG